MTRDNPSIQYGPIKAWPGKLRTSRIRAPFKAGGRLTLALLERELRMVSAEGAVVQLAMEHFNRDGRPYADARPQHPGVIVSFLKPVRRQDSETIRVPLTFAADKFLSWEANLRAIAIGLEDLRRIDRYGVTRGSEQYLGFKALPAPGPDHDSIRTIEDAARFIAEHARGLAESERSTAAGLIKSPAEWTRAYRAAARSLHPDAGGLPEPWAKLQAAKTLLDAHHGI